MSLYCRFISQLIYLKPREMLPIREMGTCLFQQPKAHSISQMAHFLSWKFFKHKFKWVKSLIDCNYLHFNFFKVLSLLENSTFSAQLPNLALILLLIYYLYWYNFSNLVLLNSLTVNSPTWLFTIPTWYRVLSPTNSGFQLPIWFYWLFPHGNYHTPTCLHNLLLNLYYYYYLFILI